MPTDVLSRKTMHRCCAAAGWSQWIKTPIPAVDPRASPVGNIGPDSTAVRMAVRQGRRGPGSGARSRASPGLSSPRRGSTDSTPVAKRFLHVKRLALPADLFLVCLVTVTTLRGVERCRHNSPPFCSVLPSHPTGSTMGPTGSTLGVGCRIGCSCYPARIRLVVNYPVFETRRRSSVG